jgi:rubrerythrin
MELMHRPPPKKLTGTCDQDLQAAVQFWLDLSERLAIAHAQELDRWALRLPGYRLWCCRQCDAVYRRDDRPVVCQRCHSTLLRLT